MKKLEVPTKVQPPSGWSYSAWGMFKKCMYQYYCVRYLRMKEEGTNYAMERGSSIHKIAEQYLKGQVTSLPPNPFRDFKRPYLELKRANPIVEQFWGVNYHWEPSNYGSWAVMKMDAAVAPSKVTDNLLWIQDLKTGREYPDHMDQGLLYATIGSSLFPKAEGFEVEFWYVDQGYAIQHKFGRDVIKEQKKLWSERGKEMLSPRKKYPTSPSESNCKYCFLRADKGGPCKDYYRGKA